jgi:dipeptidase D
LAIILALFTDQNVEHGPIEAVFTVQEETTSMGATKLSDDWIMSSYLINICSENDDTIIIGSGGCCDFNGYLPIQRKPRKDDTTDLNVRLINGVGGHSGSTIHFNTINAVVEIFNIFKMISDKYEYRIIDVKSTNQLNVIPSYCDIIINIKRNQVNHFKKTFLNHFKNLLSIHQQNDKNISLVIDNVKSNKDPLTLQDTAKLINLVVSGNSGLKVFNTTFNIP